MLTAASAHPQPYARARARAHTQTHTHIHKRHTTRTHTQTHTYTHTQTHIHTHRYTHTGAYTGIFPEHRLKPPELEGPMGRHLAVEARFLQRVRVPASVCWASVPSSVVLEGPGCALWHPLLRVLTSGESPRPFTFPCRSQAGLCAPRAELGGAETARPRGLDRQTLGCWGIRGPSGREPARSTVTHVGAVHVGLGFPREGPLVTGVLAGRGGRAVARFTRCPTSSPVLHRRACTPVQFFLQQMLPGTAA